MTIKIFWYFSSLFTILLIIINTPSNSNLGISMNQNNLFNLKSNKVFMQQIIAVNVFIFLLLTVLSLF